MAKQLAVEIFLMLFIGLVLGLFGPFGTFAIPATPRILYWFGFVLIGYVIFRPMTVLGRWMSDAMNIHGIIGSALALVIAAAPMTVLVAFALSGFRLARALAWQGIGELYFDVWLIGFLINGFFMLTFRQNRAESDAIPVSLPHDLTGSTKPPFAERLSPSFGPLLALNSEDHYVRAFSPSGSELILIRLRDAIAELGDVDGMQVHRSWWVARDAAAKITRKGRTAAIILTNEQIVPVARENVVRLKAAGWMR